MEDNRMLESFGKTEYEKIDGDVKYSVGRSENMAWRAWDSFTVQ
jgi:hypothetical protein